MKKMVLLLTMILCLALTACGNKDTDETQATETTKSSVSVEETIPEKESEEVIATEEENIGDVVISADSLSMADMQELEIGLDTPVAEIDADTSSVVEGFKVLFPGGAYITKTTNASSEVELDSIHFILSVTTENAEAPTSAREDRDETLETIGNYVVRKIVRSNGSYGVDQTYSIYDTASGKAADIDIVITKRADYQEYCDKLVEEYMPKFEEVLYSNLQ